MDPLSLVITLLVAASGVCWTIVYISCARTSFAQKTYCMPLFALGLNVAWEGIYGYLGLFQGQGLFVQAVANSCWFVFDLVLVYAWFRFGRAECATDAERRWFVPWSILVLAICVVLQLLFIQTFGVTEGEKYSAYLQNIVMSAMFLDMLRQRGSSRGQTMTIAVCKCVGTLTPTIYGGLEGNVFIVVTGLICLVLDVIYIVALDWVRRQEAARTATA